MSLTAGPPALRRARLAGLRRLPEPLLLAGLTLGVGLLFALLFARPPDLDVYLGDAGRAVREGWGHYYQARSANGSLNVDPPLQGLLVLPLLPLGAAAVAAWSVLGTGALVAGWRLASGSGVMLALLLLSPWAVLNASQGNSAALVLGAVVGGWWLAGRGRPLLAGLVLALATVKPQLVFVLPLALLASGRRRIAAAFAAGSLLAAGVGLLLVGPGGTSLLLDAWRQADIQPHNFLFHQQSIHGLVPGPAGLGLMAAAAVIATVAAHRVRGSLDLVFACGVLGALLATPYLHAQDLLLWFPVWWWVSRAAGRERWLFGVPFYLSLLAAGPALTAPLLPAGLAGPAVAVATLAPLASLSGLIAVALARPLPEGPGGG